MTEISLRLRLAQSWWLASELARRHPELLLIETHPGGGQYDCLSLVASGKTLIDINREGRIHVHDGSAEPIPLTGLFSDDDPHAVVKEVEQVARLAGPEPTPGSTPRVLSWRVAAQCLVCTLNAKQAFDVRNECEDGSYSVGPRGSLERFPLALERAREHRPDDLLDEPLYRYWAVLRDSEAVAILDNDGYAYIADRAVHIPTAYQANNRNILTTTVGVLGSVLV
jgi:hypothetical protein